MFSTKYIMSNGLAFTEREEMAKLSCYAREGWILDGFGFLGYKLKKSTPQKLNYSLDYRSNADEDYFLYFKESGWNHVCSIGNEMHIFSAREGIKPIYTDEDTESEKYISQYNNLKKIAIPSLIITIVFMFIIFLAKNNYIPDIFRKIFAILLLPAFIVTVFTGLPCLSYNAMANKTSENEDNFWVRNHKSIRRAAVFLTLIAVVLLLLVIFHLINMPYFILESTFSACFLLWVLLALNVKR